MVDSTDTRTVIILGGHGKVALLAAPLLDRAGYRVRSVVRDPAHEAAIAATGAEPVVLDLESTGTDALADLFHGTGAVVWSAGAGGGDPDRTYAVDRDAAIRAIDAAERAGVGRYLTVSYFGAGPDHGVPADDAFHPYAEAKAAADAHLRASGLAWTVLGPSRLTLDPPTGCIQVGGPKGAVSRADVAAVLAATLDHHGLVRRTVEFNNGDVPIAEALDAAAV